MKFAVSDPRPRRFRWRDLLECFSIALLFAGLLAAWSLAIGGPAPWWIVAGLGLYGVLGGIAVAWGVVRG